MTYSNQTVANTCISLIVFSDYESLPAFYIVYEDWSRFDGIVINCSQSEEQEKLSSELSELFYAEDGHRKLVQVTQEELIEIVNDQFIDHIVNCGFAP